MNLWDLDAEEPVSDFMFSFDGFRSNFGLLTDTKGELCLPPRKYKPGQARPAESKLILPKLPTEVPKMPELTLRQKLI